MTTSGANGFVGWAKAVLRYAAFGTVLGILIVLPFAIAPSVAAVFRQASLGPLVEGIAACFTVTIAGIFVGGVPALGTGLLLAPLRHRLDSWAGMGLAATVGAVLTMAWIVAMSFPLTPWKYGLVGALAAVVVSMTLAEDDYRRRRPGIGDSP